MTGVRTSDLRLQVVQFVRRRISSTVTHNQWQPQPECGRNGVPAAGSLSLLELTGRLELEVAPFPTPKLKLTTGNIAACRRIDCITITS